METEKEIEDVVNKFDFNHLYEIINSKSYSEKNWLKGKSIDQLKEYAKEAIRFSFSENCKSCCLNGFEANRDNHEGVDIIGLRFTFGDVCSIFENNKDKEFRRISE